MAQELEYVGMGALCILVVKEVFAYLKSKALKSDLDNFLVDDAKVHAELNTRVQQLEARAADIQDRVKDLWVWHNVKDVDGVPVWYVRKSLEQAVSNLAETFRDIKDLLNKQNHVWEQQTELLKKLLDKEV